MAQSAGYHEPFFWHRVVNVGWGGRVATVTITAVASYDVEALVPVEPTENFSGGAGSVLERADYSDKGVLRLPVSGETGTLLLEDELTGVIIVDRSNTTSGFVTQPNSEGETPGLDLFNEQVALGSGIEGRPPDLLIIGAIYIEDFTEHTHPNGHVVTYVSGFTPITFSPPDFDWTDSAQALWFHTTTIPEQVVSIIRRSWLVNFGNRGVSGPTIELAGLFAASTGGSVESTYAIRLYSVGTQFTLAADGSVAANRTTVIPEQTGSVPGAFTGYAVTFDKNGIVAEAP